jgi:hypothetical protein
LNSPPHHSPLFPLLEYFQQVSFFIYIHVYTVFVLYSPSYPFLTSSPLPTGTILPRQDLWHPPVLKFCKRKKMTFLFV